MAEQANEWVILAHKHRNSGSRNDGAPFYGPNHGGYRMTLTEAGLYSEQEARAIVAGTQKGDFEAFHFAAPELRAYLENWGGQLRRVEFDLFHQVREMAAYRALVAAELRKFMLRAIHPGFDYDNSQQEGFISAENYVEQVAEALGVSTGPTEAEKAQWAAERAARKGADRV